VLESKPEAILKYCSLSDANRALLWIKMAKKQIEILKRRASEPVIA
jgi:hypothetical protein